jgi:RNA-directed DNA polymerase
MDVYTKQQRIAQLARGHPEWSFNNLAHMIDLEWLHEAYVQTRKDGAVGVDGQTAGEYAQELGKNLEALKERAKAGTYKAPPVRRVHIPKGTGKETRPIGIPTFEDKVLQRAVVMVLEPLYEQDFYECSYGFRPRRSAHQALEKLWECLMLVGGGWVLEVDLRKYFDTLDHGVLRNVLDLRVRDGVIRRLIGKWLKAGVWEEGRRQEVESGTPQGGVISPLLSNIYLHEALDKWFETAVKARMRGRVYLIRYADDFVMVFELEEDARRVLEVLPKRLARFGLTLHPDKTRLINFRVKRGGGNNLKKGPDSNFDFLGFTHFWGKSRKGKLAVRRKTARKRYSRGLKAIAVWCRTNRHLAVIEQYKQLRAKLLGHYSYYGMTGNFRSLNRFKHEVERIWHKWLARRSHKHAMPWDRFVRLLQFLPLPPARIVHSVFGISQRRICFEEPDAGNPLVRVCGGAASG